MKHYGAAILCFALLSACSSANKAPDVTGPIRDSLKQAGLNDISVSQDRDKGVVTLKGHVPGVPDKERARSIAQSLAGPEVVADEVAVITPGAESDSKTINKDVDEAIRKNLDAALVQNALQHDVHYDVNNAVVTLNGTVNTQALRRSTEQMAADVPNVRQVVNKLDVKNQPATSTR